MSATMLLPKNTSHQQPITLSHRPRPSNWRKFLAPGDQVYWTDPDRGLCSRLITIRKIEYSRGGIVHITDVFGGFVQAYLRELS